MTAPAFAMIDEGKFRWLKKAEQLGVMNQAWLTYPTIGGSDTNTDGRWAIVRAANQLYWDDQQKAAARSRHGKPDFNPSPAVKLNRIAGRCEITATEVNDWLATLPPFGLAGIS